MTKAILRFDLSDFDDKDEYVRCIKATDAFLALDEIQQECFRPARKNMYNDRVLNDLIEKVGDDAFEIIDMLEQKYVEIMNKYELFGKIS